MLALLTTASPAHARLFAPPARASDYSFATTTESLQAVVADYRKRWPSTDSRSWSIRTISALEVFDGAALYDRSRLARLYKGRTPRIARGPITEGGAVTAVVLVVSPYPEPDLQRLNPGTLIMTVRVAKGAVEKGTATISPSLRKRHPRLSACFAPENVTAPENVAPENVTATFFGMEIVAVPFSPVPFLGV